MHYTERATPSRNAISGIVVFLLLALLPAGLAQAQFADEVWVEPNWFDRVDVPGCSGACCGFLSQERRADYLANVTDRDAWPTTFERTHVFSALLSLFRKPCDDGTMVHQRFTDPELQQLATFFNDSGLELAVDVAAFRINNTSICEISNGTNLSGENQAESDYNHYFQRWYAAGGRLDHFSLDHPIWWMFLHQHYLAQQTPNAPWADPECANMTLADGAQEIADYFVRLKTLVEENHSGVTFEPSIGLWGSAAGHPFTTVDGQTFPAIWTPAPAQGLTLEDVIDAIALELESTEIGGSNPFELDHFFIDIDSDILEDPQDPEIWDFTRVIELERALRQLGLGVGISNHLGPCADENWAMCDLDGVGPGVVDDQWARDHFLRYAEEYVAAGGNPDLLQAYSWHAYPSQTGPETAANSFFNITRDVLRDVYPEAVEIPQPVADFTTPGSRWTFTGGWDVSTAQAVSSASGLDVARLEDGTFDSLDARVQVQLDTQTQNGWAGIHVRKTQPGDVPWTSGYLAQVRRQGATDQVVLSKPGVTLASVESPVDLTQNVVELRVNARGNRIRVYLGGMEMIDWQDDDYTGGYVSLSTLDQEATFDDFDIRRVLLAEAQFEDRFEDGAITGWTVSGNWQESNGEMTGNGQTTVTGLSLADLRISAELQFVDPGTDWVALQLRKPSATSMPWTGGYTVLLREDGELSLYRAGAGVLESYQSGLDLVASPVQLEVVAAGHRLQVFVVDPLTRDGNLVIDMWDDAGPLAAGLSGLVTQSQDVRVDDLIVEELVESADF